MKTSRQRAEQVGQPGLGIPCRVLEHHLLSVTLEFLCGSVDSGTFLVQEGHTATELPRALFPKVSCRCLLSGRGSVFILKFLVFKYG